MPAVSISLPASVLTFVDAEAKKQGISRSAWLTRLLMVAQTAEEVRVKHDEPKEPEGTCPDCGEVVPEKWLGKPHNFGTKCPPAPEAEA